MIHRQTLSKSERLKSYKRIRILFAQGQKFKVFPLVVYFLLGAENVEELSLPAEGRGGLERLSDTDSVEGVEVDGGELREVEGGLERLSEVDSVEVVEGDLDRLEKKERVLQMGVSVGKRHFKRAVDRNLLKRRIRESYRKQKNELNETLVASGCSMDVFFVYANARISDYTEIEKAMISALGILCTKIAIK